MNVRKTLNWDKLAIVLSVAVITLVLMAQTMYASGAAQADGGSTDPCDASPTLDECVGDGEPTDPCDASPTLDECVGDGDGGSTDPCDASPTSDECVGDGDGGPTDPCDASPTLDECVGDGDGGVGEATETDDGGRGDKPIPPGQLVRRGIFGTVDGYVEGGVIIETKFGYITVLVEDATSYADGERFSALLDKSPVPPEATETIDGSFRTVTALRVKGVPAKASRKHLRSVVVDSASGTDDANTLTILDDDGNEIELENDGASGTLDGEDTILLIKGQGLGPPVVIGGITSSSVQKRLERLLEKASPEKLAKLEELIQKRQEKLEARLQHLEDNAPPRFKDKVREARDKSKGRGASGGDEGGPSDKGKPEDKGNSNDKGKDDKDAGGGGGPPADRGNKK